MACIGMCVSVHVRLSLSVGAGIMLPVPRLVRDGLSASVDLLSVFTVN